MFNIFRRQNKEENRIILNSAEYEAVLKRIADVNATVTELKNQVLSVTLEMDAFRNKVMRAYQRKRITEEEEQPQAEIGKPVKRRN